MIIRSVRRKVTSRKERRLSHSHFSLGANYMSKRNRDWNQSKLNRYLKEGRGQGEGKDYKPWITIQDFPSKGRCSRLLGWKTQRIHHFLSDIETKYFYLLDWEDTVIDIREHFPLLDLGETIQHKDDLNLSIFSDKSSGTPYVLCTSFLITQKDLHGKKIYAARSIKAASELEKKITLEKLEFERRYWEQKGIPWAIITQKNIPMAKVKNIEWIHSSLYSSNDRGLNGEEMRFLCSTFMHLISGSSRKIRILTEEFDKEYNLEPGTGLYIFKYLIAVKKITVDMDTVININQSANRVVTAIKVKTEVNNVVNS